jgi:hypothetical protein
MKWFRFYDEALDDPKVQRLPGDLFKLWINLLCLANRGRERGMLPTSLEDVAWALRLDVTWLETSVAVLHEQGLLDWCEDDNQYQPHNWEGRQYSSDDVTARVQQHRRNKAVTPEENVTLHETLHVTPPETEQIQSRADTETEQKSDVRRKRRIPQDFAISEEMREWAVEKEITGLIDIDYETEEFITHWRGVGTPMLDWEQTWQNDMIKKAGWARKDARRAGGHKNGQKPNSTGRGAAIERISAELTREALNLAEEADSQLRIGYGQNTPRR